MSAIKGIGGISGITGTCPHGKPVGIACRLCELRLPPLPASFRSNEAAPCEHLGKRLSAAEKGAADLRDGRDWRHCGHPRQPLGQVVCQCRGCGPGTCWGYRAEDAPADTDPLEMNGHDEPARPDVLPPAPPLLWACGLTCVPERADGLLPRTLEGVRRGGFPAPRLFLDGAGHAEAAALEARLGLPVSARFPRLRAFASWLLALEEVYLREPHVDRYAMFQDDLTCCRNARDYLDRCAFPERGYLNLYTFPENQVLAPRTAAGGTADGWYLANQRGKGAVALVFSNEGCRTLLQHRHMVDRPHDPPPPGEPERPFKAIDGAVVSAMKKAGWQEWVHSPSLVQHLGERSTLGNERHALAESWRGEEWDALSLLR